MLAPVGVLVIAPSKAAREELVAAVGRSGHAAFGVSNVEEARARRGRRAVDVLLFDRPGWTQGGQKYLLEHGEASRPRVLMAGDLAACLQLEAREHRLIAHDPLAVDKGQRRF